MAKDILFGAFFTDADGLGLTGLAPTIDVWRVATADLSKTEIVTAGSLSEIGDGVYAYRVPAANLQLYYYYGVAKTASDDASQKHVAAVILDFADAPGIAEIVATSVWASLTSALTTVGSIGKLLVDRIDAAISTRSTLGAGAQMDLVDTPNATARAALATAVWASGTRTLTSISAFTASIAQAVWTFGTRTLTQSVASLQDVIDGTSITRQSGSTWVISITGLGSLTGYDKIWFTLKDDPLYEDSKAVLQIAKHADESADGLIVLDGAATGLTATDAEIEIDDEAVGNITITVQAAATAQITPGVSRYYDIKMLKDGAATPLSANGTFNAIPSVTHRFS